MLRSEGVIVDTTILAGADSRDDFAVALNRELRGSFQFFSSAADRDAWTRTYPSRLYGTVACVFDTSATPPQIAANFYKWTGASEDGSDGAWALVPIAHSAAATLLKWASTASAQSGSAATFNFNFGLKAERALAKDEVDITLDRKLFAESFAPDFLATAQEPLVLYDNKAAPVARSAVWFGPTLLPANFYVEPDQVNRSLKVSPREGVTQEQLLIVFLVSFDGQATTDGSIVLEARSSDAVMDAGDLVRDVNNQPLAVERQYKQGQDLDYVTVASIIELSQSKYFTFHVISSFTDAIRTSVEDNRISAILLQAVDGAPRGLYAFEHMSGMEIKWTLHHMQDPIITLEPVLSMALAKKTYATLQDSGNRFQEDGFTLIPLTQPVEMEISGKGMIVNSVPGAGGPTYFYIVRTLYGGRLAVLRGKSLRARLSLAPGREAGFFKVLSWNGTESYDNVPPVYASVTNDTPDIGPNWREIKSVFISADLGSDRTGELQVAVPSDSKVLAFVFTMMQAEDPVTYTFKTFIVDLVGEAFTGAHLSYIRPKNERFLETHPGYTRFLQTNETFAALRYTLNAKESPSPIGIPTKFSNTGTSVVLDHSVNKVPGSDAQGGEGALKFTKATTANITTIFRASPGEKLGVGESAPVTFTWYKVDTKDDMTPFPNGSHTVTVHAGGRTVIGSFDIAGNFDLGDRLALRMKTSKDDGAFLISYSKEKPLIEVIVTTEELNI